MREQEGVFCPWQCLRGDLQEELTKKALPLLDGRDQIDLGLFSPCLGMKIATFNINNVNKRLGNLLDWLKATDLTLPPSRAEGNRFRISGRSD
jgi:hypothetical protein